MEADSALLAASALHAGFQATVTLVVYPALAELAPTAWVAGHAAHSRRATLVVGPVYLAVATACLWALVALPITTAVALAVAGHALAAVITALVAAPAHSRLGRDGRTPEVLRRLLVADRVRLAGALLALIAAALMA